MEKTTEGLFKLIGYFEELSEVGTEISKNFKEFSFEDKKKAKSIQYLTKSLDNSYSILRLFLSNSNLNLKSGDTHWDFSSIISLCRNLIELSNISWYLIEDEISNEEFKFRLDVLMFHHFISTEYIFERIYNKKETVDFLTDQKLKYLKKIKFSNNFKNLNKGTQKLILQGKKSTILTHYEIAEKRKIDLEQFKAYYKLMSIHTHSSPTALNQLVKLRKKDFDIKFELMELALLIDYCSSHFASIIKSVIDLWEIPYPSEQAELIIEDYSDFNNCR